MKIAIFCLVAVIAIFVIRFFKNIIKEIKEEEAAKKGDSNQGQNESLLKKPSSELKSQIEFQHGYYRYQKDNQFVIQRNPLQKRIFEEYFVVPNMKSTTCNPALKKKSEIFGFAKFVGFALAVISLIVCIVNDFEDVGAWIAFGIIGIVAGIACIVASKHFLSLFEKSIKSTVRPKKLMTDEEYEALVSERIASLNIVRLGIEKMHLNEEEVTKIEPIILHDNVITGTSLVVHNSSDGSVHSSTQCVSVIYSTATQLFVYKIQFDMCCGIQDEWTSEFFYDDICDICFHSYKEIIEVDKSKFEHETRTISIVSTNSSIGFTVNKNSSFESFSAMRQSIRARRQR